MILQQRKMKGVTLIEMLLVLVIIASVLVMFASFMQQKTDELKRDKTAMQMEMILNAGLAFYLNSNLPSQWPTNLAALQPPNNPSYLPATFNNPWGQPYTAQQNPNNAALFQVSTTIPGGVTADTTAQLIAGRLPLATCQTVTTVPGCTAGAAQAQVTASVPVPGQNLNNARAVNFGSLYTVNGCVPKPFCPLNMTPEIFVVPVSVSGTNDQSGQIALPAAAQNVYPISSFTANAIDLGVNATGPNCGNTNPNMACNWNGTGGGGTQPSASGFWRVCLSVTTEKGAVPVSTVMGTVMAITRCVPVAENPGTGIGVW